MDLSLINGQIHEHGFLVGVLVGTILPALAPKVLDAATTWVLKASSLAIPPAVAGVKRLVVLVLAHPLARAIVIKNKDAVLKLEDALVGAVKAIAEAVDAAFDAAIEDATKK